MAFPRDPRDVLVELYLNDNWVDVTSDVRTESGINITRGKQNESSRVAPAQCNFVLDNRDRKYSNRNPQSIYYGYLGRSTPVRVALAVVRDTFTRVSASGWGSTDSGHSWRTLSTGGVVAATDYTVAGGKGLTLMPAAATFRSLALDNITARDMEVEVTSKFAFNAATGGYFGSGVMFRRGPLSAGGYSVQLVIQTTGAVELWLMNNSTGSIIYSEATGLTHSTSATVYRIRAQIEGQTARAKAWVEGTNEPLDWLWEIHDSAVSTPNSVGVRSMAQSTNTNRPTTVTYDNFVARSIRFAGEVANWPSNTTLSGRESVVEIEASTILRRLSQGAATVTSPLRRAIPTAANLIAYWPLEEGPLATSVSSGMITNGLSMQVKGSPKYGESDDLYSSSPIATLNGAEMYGPIQPYTSTGNIAMRCYMTFPASYDVEGMLFGFDCTGTVNRWEVHSTPTAGLRMYCYRFTSTGLSLIYDSGGIAFNLAGKTTQLTFNVMTSGANVAWTIDSIPIGTDTTSGFGTTILAQSIGRATEARVNIEAVHIDVAVGHVSLEKQDPGDFDRLDQLNAYSGESAYERFSRVCGENGINYGYFGSSTNTGMGPQPVDTLLNIFKEIEDTNFGTIYESRSSNSLIFKERSYLYNASTTTTLSYSGGNVSAPFEPTDDDQLVRNDIVLKRSRGSETRATDTTGTLSTSNIGIYTESYEVNSNSDSNNDAYAYWRLHLGTIDEPRYPVISTNFAAPDVVSSTTLPIELLDVDIDDRITVTSATVNGIYNDIRQLVRGMTENIRPYTHTLTFNCSPASAYDVFVLDSSIYGRLDATAATLTSAITSTATSISVTTTASSGLWTTSDVPFTIIVGGETMTVTAVAGAASPQTFTVTRSVNSVVKAHNSGTAVRLFNPTSLSL